MNDSVLVLSIVSAIVAGTPILFAALGEIMTERSGVMNLGVEGMMLIGGVTGFWTGVQTGNLWLALLAGGLAGASLSMIHALLAISLRVNQIVSGLALVIVGNGLSAFWGSTGSDPLIQRQNGVDVDPVLPEALRDLPGIGPIVFGHDPVVYLSWLIVAGASYFLYRTTPGLALRAVGEDPAAADARTSVLSRMFVTASTAKPTTPRLAVSHPLHGECTAAGAEIRGFAQGGVLHEVRGPNGVAADLAGDGIDHQFHRVATARPGDPAIGQLGRLIGGDGDRAAAINRQIIRSGKDRADL